jgi:hypothetical protein
MLPERARRLGGMKTLDKFAGRTPAGPQNDPLPVPVSVEIPPGATEEELEQLRRAEEARQLEEHSPEAQAERKRAIAERAPTLAAGIRASRDAEAERFLGLEPGELAELRALLRKRR